MSRAPTGSTTTCAVAERWMAAVATRDDATLLALAHPDIIVRPALLRRRRTFRGTAGIRRWLAELDGSGTDTAWRVDAVEAIDGSRVLAEGTLTDDGTSLVTVLEVREGRIAAARTYLSDRRLLESIGEV